MIVINAKTINDAWFKALQVIIERDNDGVLVNAYHTGIINRGSFQDGQGRLQLPAVAIEIEYPDQDWCVIVPKGCPEPTNAEKIERYFYDKIVGCVLGENETYTYGERILPQLEAVIDMLRNTSITNQACISISKPEDIFLTDPPCLRNIHFKVIEVKLDMWLDWRSWDLYAGMPENLGGLSFLQVMVAEAVGAKVGMMRAVSDGLHLYDYQIEAAELRLHPGGPSVLDHHLSMSV